MMRSSRKGMDVLLLAAGFAIWSSAFASLYGLSGIGCAMGWDQILAGPVSMLRLALSAVWLAHCGAGLWLARYAARRRHLRRDMFTDGAYRLSLAALAASVATGAPGMVLSLCR